MWNKMNNWLFRAHILWLNQVYSALRIGKKDIGEIVVTIDIRSVNNTNIALGADIVFEHFFVNTEMRVWIKIIISACSTLLRSLSSICCFTTRCVTFPFFSRCHRSWRRIRRSQWFLQSWGFHARILWGIPTLAEIEERATEIQHTFNHEANFKHWQYFLLMLNDLAHPPI